VCRTRRESQLELSEPSPGLFVLECEYEDRFTPKDAGLQWHAGERCKRPKCSACAADIGRAWHTADVLKALKLAEHASSELRADIMRRAQPMAEEQVASERDRARAARVLKLQRVRSLQASGATDSTLEVPAPDGLEYMPYQRAAIAFALSRPNTLIADEMGLGKTIEALGVVNADSTIQRVLIVCPASLKLNWKREAERWLTRPMQCEVAGKSFPEDADVVIINYERLGKWESQLARGWDLLIADECHYVKNRDAKRTKRLFAIKSPRMLFLTGTPILNRPIELHPIAGHLAPEAFGDFWTYAKRFCSPVRNNYGWDFNGAANLDELHELLRSTVMIRRTKAGVLPDLPPKRRQVIELASDSMTRLIARETKAWDEHSHALAEIRGRARASSKGADAAPDELTQLRKQLNVAFGELSKLRRETALAKVPLVVEHMRNAIESSGKLVVFAHHRDVISALAEPFGDAVVTLTGEHTLEQRQSNVDRFQDDPDCALFIGSITAAGLGLTLTAASHVMFAELDWVPAHLTQAEDRTHRIGQENSVLVQHLVLQDSLDARMIKTLIKKQRIVDKVVDGDLQTELFGDELAQELIEAASARSHEDADD
jgi:SWI/SNF-related matrix-associated actin-dependent regulator 1 of chromatin subfamily A